MTDTFDVAGDFVPAQTLAEPFTIAQQPTIPTPTPAPTATASVVASAKAAPVAATTEPSESAAPVRNGFAELGLAPELVQACMDLGYTEPTTVQQKAIPLAMASVATSGKASQFVDLMVSSQTGSGKTAAFLLPVLHTLLVQQAAAELAERTAYEQMVAEAAANGQPAPKRGKRKDPTNPRNFKAATPGALVVCPTRELAQQVAHDAIELVKHCRGLRIANIVGGMPYQLQIAKLQNANLVVATPGRLLDLQRSMQIKLDQVQFLVVDEADRMLDLGFSDDLAEINQLTIERKQTMMFSATFAPRIQQLAARVMREPQRVSIDNPQEKHVNIEQTLYWADNAQHKRKLLDHWLRDASINQAIVFASTQIECDGLANDLQQDGFSAVALHGALSQGLRNRRLMALRQGQVQILVATDVAARGIDVPTISHVFNFGLPMKAEDYTHRIGRTGRAGRDGLAVTFAELRDRRKIFDIEAYTRQPLKTAVVAGLEPQVRAPQSRPGFAPRSRGAEFGTRDRKPTGWREAGFAPKAYGRDQAPAGARGERGGDRFGSNDRFASNERGADRGGERGSFSNDRAPSSYVRKGGFNDRFSGRSNEGHTGAAPAPRSDRGQPRADFGAPRAHAGARKDFGAPRADFGAPRSARPDFAERKPAFGKPAFAKSGAGATNSAKVFVPKDSKKRPARSRAE